MNSTFNRKLIPVLIAVLLFVWFNTADSAGLSAGEEASLSIKPDKVVNRIDEKVYGHFLEHIYHSVNGGLWGELVWGRSFEDAGNGPGLWEIEDDRLCQKSMATNVRLVFGDASWSDYEYTLEAKKTSGSEGFLVMFRVAGEDGFYWFNFGGWGNQYHRLERGLKGARWHAISKQRPGRIKTGKWYKIRVRCRERHFQVWLGEEKLLDFTDGENAHLRGKVGVGTWSTKACFRNIKVTSLEGKTLFEGLPEAVESAKTVAKPWEGYGKGKFHVVKDNPLNDESCQRIVSNAQGEAGVEQKPVCIGEDREYTGSLWVRGEAPNGFVVRLLDGVKTLDEVTFKPPGSEWKEYCLTFNPRSSATDGSIQVGLRGKGRLWIGQVSLMSDAARKTGGFRPDLFEAVAALKPPVIRWPGGCFASWYRWKDGIGEQHERRKYPINIWDDRDTNAFGTDEFIELCRRVGAEPLIVVNIGTRDEEGKRGMYLKEARQWIEYCNGPPASKWGKVRAANGHPEPYGVKYWEIDNETWSMGCEEYAEAVGEFVPGLKKVDPSIKIAACGSGGFNLEWNRKIIELCGGLIDYLSIHHYESPKRYADGPKKYEDFIRKVGELIAESENPDMKIYVSEWNAQSTDWRTGLYAGGLLNGFERCGGVAEMAGPALFLRHASATAWDNAFINFDHSRWFPGCNYVVMKLWRDHWAPKRVMLTGEKSTLNCVATRSDSGDTVYFKAVNPAAKKVPVVLSVDQGFETGKADFRIVAPGDLRARNTLSEPRAVRPGKAPVEISGGSLRFEMPAWSAGVVTVKLSAK